VSTNSCQNQFTLVEEDEADGFLLATDNFSVELRLSVSSISMMRLTSEEQERDHFPGICDTDTATTPALDRFEIYIAEYAWIRPCPLFAGLLPVLPRFCCKTGLWDVCGMFWRRSLIAAMHDPTPFLEWRHMVIIV